MTVVGDVMLKHGKLVDLDLNCTGELSSSVEVYFFTKEYAPSMMQKISSFVKVLVLGYTAGTSWRKDTTSLGMRLAMTPRS